MKKFLIAFALLVAIGFSGKRAEAGWCLAVGPVFPVYAAPVAPPPPVIVRPAPILIAPRRIIGYGRLPWEPRWRRW